LNISDDSIDTASLPRHVAIIMDGNGRWARGQNLNRIEGHKKGTEVVRKIVELAREIGIQVLTLFAFSEENWNRPEEEVSALMSILAQYLKKEAPKMMKEGIRLTAIGRLDSLPERVSTVLGNTISKTENNSDMILNLALSYGSRTEIVDAVRSIAKMVADDSVTPSSIDEALFCQHLYTKNLPDPDLLIRTSGEMRLSNFLLFQMAYTELFITDTLWPDFTDKEFLHALREYAQRERRFGLTSDQIQSMEK
jgi:undecaprenyl diphosphate synthase